MYLVEVAEVYEIPTLKAVCMRLLREKEWKGPHFLTAIEVLYTRGFPSAGILDLVRPKNFVWHSRSFILAGALWK
jgi:hypothetical protein